MVGAGTGSICKTLVQALYGRHWHWLHDCYHWPLTLESCAVSDFKKIIELKEKIYLVNSINFQPKYKLRKLCPLYYKKEKKKVE